VRVDRGLQRFCAHCPKDYGSAATLLADLRELVGRKNGLGAARSSCSFSQSRIACCSCRSANRFTTIGPN